MFKFIITVGIIKNLQIICYNVQI